MKVVGLAIPFDENSPFAKDPALALAVIFDVINNRSLNKTQLVKIRATNGTAE